MIRLLYFIEFYTDPNAEPEKSSLFIQSNKIKSWQVQKCFTVVYIPTEYWVNRGKVYQDRFKYGKKTKLQEKVLLEYLKNVVPPFRSVLEVGCGFGRITSLILSNFSSIQKYTAVDLSPDQIENARKNISLLRNNKTNILSYVEFKVGDIKSLTINKKYDLVIAVEVLMHILPEEILSVVMKLASLSNFHLINLDYYQDVPIPLAPHNFLHQYENLYDEISTVEEVRKIDIKKRGLFSIDTTQSIFHAKLKNHVINNEYQMH